MAGRAKWFLVGIQSQRAHSSLLQSSTVYLLEIYLKHVKYELSIASGGKILHISKRIDRLCVRLFEHVAKRIRGHEKDTIYPRNERKVVAEAIAYF